MDFDDLVTILWEIDADYYERVGETSKYEDLHNVVNELEEFVDKNNLWEHKVNEILRGFFPKDQ